MSRLAENDHLPRWVVLAHLQKALTDALLQCQHHRAGGIHQFDTQLLGLPVGRWRLSVGTYQHLLARQPLQLLMAYHAQTPLAQSLHLGTIVHNVAQAVERAVVCQLHFCRSDGLHNPETKSRIIINSYLQFSLLI